MNWQSQVKDYLASMRAAYVIGASGEVWWAMTQLAQLYIQQGNTQIASDTLAFILLQADVPADTSQLAFELFDDLERSICPRVIYSAREFAGDMDLIGMVEYLLEAGNDLPAS